MMYRKKYNGNLDEDVKKPHILEERSQNTHVKEAALGTLALLFSAGTWLLIRAVLLQEIVSFGSGDAVSVNSRTLSYVAVSILLLCVHIVLLRFTVKFSRSNISVLTVLSSGLIPLVIFFQLNVFYILIGTALFIAGIFLWYATVKRADARVGAFSLMYTLRSGLSTILLLYIALISFLRFVDYIGSGRDSSAFKETTIAYTLVGVNEVFQVIFKGYTPAMTVDDFILLLNTGSGDAKTLRKEQERLVESLLVNLPVEISFDVEAYEGQKAIVRQSFFENLKLADMGFTGDTSISEVWKALLTSRASHITNRFERFVPIIVALGLFFTLYLFKFLYKLLVYGFGWIILHSFLKTNFFIKERKQIFVNEIRL